VTQTPELRRSSVRVAAAATALVALAYAVIGVAVVAFVTSSLTAQLDARLATALERESDDRPREGGPRADERPLGQERGVWRVTLDGTVTTAEGDLDLPAEDAQVVGPTTVTIGDAEIRIAGVTTPTGRLVVGESMDPVNDARTTVIIGGLLVAPLLLGAVFVGAVVIGRRVAAPIEAARRRQLDLAADASHELRTPLAVIEAHASLALAQTRDVAWYDRAFRKVDAESRRMRRLLEDMLWLARLDATQPSRETSVVDLVTAARRSAERFEPVAQARRLALSVVAQDDYAGVAVPAEWLDRLLGVLVDNACKYAPDGGSVTVRVTTDERRVTLAVEDSGPGVADDVRARVFDRFHRATDAAAGSGLGLAIGDAIVRRTEGRWDVGQAPAGGARFAVTWPLPRPAR
jgi:signal transduction histidine kinase